MFTPLYPPVNHHRAPDAQGVPCLHIDTWTAFLVMSIGGHEGAPDDWGVGLDMHIPDNDNEAPFAWRDRRPTY